MEFYWPQAGIVTGIVLNVVGLALENSDLIATGSNLFTVSGLFLVQRRKNAK